MNTTIAVVIAACAMVCGSVAAATWKILDRISDAVEHLEQHLEKPQGVIEDEAREIQRQAADRSVFFAPPTSPASGECQ